MWTPLKATIFLPIQRSLARAKESAKERTVERRRLKDQIRYQNETIAHLRAEVAQLKAITDPMAVFNCHYPAQMMVLAVFIVLHGGSLRCAAATVGFFSKELMGWKYQAPSKKTISNWVERCGLYALKLSQDLKGQYIGVSDLTIQMGKEQLCLLLGVRLEVANKLDRPLTTADIAVLGMEVRSSWTGTDIAEFIKRSLAMRPGVELVYMVCDQGTNLLAALRQLAIPVVSDCGHVMMNLVKKLFDKDLGLSKLSAEIGLLRQKLNLTDYAFLLPPTLRDKDRFLRTFTLVDWIDRIDSYWPNLSTEVRAKLSFYRNRWLNLRLRQVHHLLVLTAKILKYSGLSESTYHQWSQEVATWKLSQPQLTTQAREFIDGIETYFNAYADRYVKGNQLLCCSDIIESIFGRYKNKGGMKAISADVLSIALYNQDLSTSFVQTAMKSVTGPMLDKWRSENVCNNRFGVRRRMEKELKNAGE